MSISNYQELQSAVGHWLDRTDLADVMPDFIKLAENYMNFGGSRGEPLRVREMQTQITLTSINGVVTLPKDFLSAIAVTALTDGGKTLQQISISGAETGYSNHAAGLAQHYMIIGEELRILPKSNVPIRLTYYRHLTPLSDDNSSNWLIEKHSDLYLRASQMMATEFIKDYNQTAIMRQVVDQYIEQLNDAELFDGLRHSEMMLGGQVV